MKSILFLLLLTMVTFSCTQPTVKEFTTQDKEAIIKNLTDAQADWNSGDLERFMNSYWKSDSMQFISNKGINFGWRTTLNNYQKNYPDTAVMGKLRFEILRINPLSSNAAFLTGRFFLKRTIGDADGIFTLVFRKIDGKWVAVYDHTSD